MPITMDVPERGNPETTTIGAPNDDTTPMIATPVRHLRVHAFSIAVAAGLLLTSPTPADAYIGPGAGFALFSSFFVFITTVVIAALSLLVWPFRKLWRVMHRTRRGRPLIKRLVILGFDGQDPRLTDRYLQAGRLPNFHRLAKTGSYNRLRTTFPSVSPVAWSSFSTGTNPARHNIFDFLDRDRRTYLPTLSSTHIGPVERVLRVGRFRIPLTKPVVRVLRKSRPFWSILGEHGIWSTILRVPITFPPDRFYGAQLSAMAVPDLRGTQGTFTFYTTRRDDTHTKEGGLRVLIELYDDKIDTTIQGPDNPIVPNAPPLEVSLRVRLDRTPKRAYADVDGTHVTLTPGQMTDWISLRFRVAPGISTSGICRLLLTEMDEHVSLYVTPINIDPDKPAMPISHPSFYATYLSKRIGRFATLGLAEDTWALNEGVIRDADFLQQAYDIDREREAMFFAALDRLRSGTLVSVFDATDRIQHMFWRQLETGDGTEIQQLYEHNDALVGRVVDRLQPGDMLMVLSDHGFAPFRRGVNINSWLRDQGYLALKPGTDGTREWLRDVDWTKTRAYALGLAGMFLNLEGRERDGVVKRGAEADALKAELISRLSGLVDPASGEIGINEVFDSARLYSGPYLANAPDFIVGYNRGYRISWESATGVVAGPVFQDNAKAWSGDHCIDPRLVPGVLFCSRPIEQSDPGLIDIAPTVLRLFGIEPPSYMEGTPLFQFGPHPGVAK
jgi:predicted AlkP superfamily phosphohydrolase/phosphomutase